MASSTGVFGFRTVTDVAVSGKVCGGERKRLDQVATLNSRFSVSLNFKESIFHLSNLTLSDADDDTIDVYLLFFLSHTF